MKKNFIILLLIVCASLNNFAQKIVRYDLFVSDTTVNFSGKEANAISINGQIPGPALNFTEGDTAEIYVHNLMDVETSIHWHGVILPNEQDGVPNLTTTPVYPHTTHLYKFPIVQYGTYWYHSHTGLQEQSGVYGALIFHKSQKDSIPEFAVVLSDWTNENPDEVLRTLKMANDWYSIEKGSTQNYGEALLKGYLGAKLEQEWLRMYPMDVSDVYYDAFLTNGHIQQSLPELKAGDKIRLRIINGSSSTYFWLQFAGGRLTVVASDGEEIVPVEVDRMIIGVAETYDVIVTIPQNMSYEFRATAEDRTNSTSLWLGDGMKMHAPTLPTLKYFEGMKMMNRMMNFDGTMDDMGMQMSDQEMDMNNVMYPEISGSDEELNNSNSSDTMQMNMNSPSGGDITTLNYGMLRSPGKTTLPGGAIRVLQFNLTGNMNRYQWSINNTTLDDTDKILIRKGENVRIILTNQTMMRHPMHLHGHYFRVINGQGDYAPLKNVLDIMPMETDTIEFAAQYYGDWFFHCHILYHMMSGMGRIFSYANSIPNAQINAIPDAWNKFISDENMWFFSAFIAGQSNGLFPKAKVINRNYDIDAIGQVSYKGDYQVETHIGRFIGQMQYFKLYIGSELSKFYDHKSVNKQVIENKLVAALGIQYLLPMFIQSDLRIDHRGTVRFQVSRSDLALTSRLRFDGLWNTDKEYELGFRYIVTKRISLSADYDSHFGAGGGISLNY